MGNKVSKSASKKSTGVKKRLRNYEPCLLNVELLEDRIAPALISWNVDADGFWDEAANWDLGRAPQAGDDVVIDRPGVDLTITHRSGSSKIQSLTSEESLRLTGSGFTITDAAVVNGSFTLTGEASLVADGASASLIANGPTSIGNSSITARNGATISLPFATSYAHGDWFFRTRTLRADGAGSLLDLSNVTTVTGARGISSILNIQATGGGVVDLSGATAHSDGGTVVLADGAGSRVDFSSLTSFRDVYPHATSSVTARNNGEVRFASPFTMQGANVSLQPTGVMDMAQLTSYRDASMTVSGVAADFTNLNTFLHSALTLTGGGTANMNQVTIINQSSFFVNDGATLSLPSASIWSGRTHSDTFFRAKGAGSVLDLSNVTTLHGGGFISTHFIQAQDGGRVDMSGLPEISSGATNVSAFGAGNVIDFSALTGFFDNNNNRLSRLEAHTGAAILTPNLTNLSGVDLQIHSSGTMPTAQIVAHTFGSATVNGGASADFSGMTNITGSRFTLIGGGTANLDNAAQISQAGFFVNDGVTLALPSATSWSGQTHSNTEFRASGVGSVLDLSALTSMSGGDFISTHFVRAFSGGLVDLSGVTAISGGATDMLADGADSLIDFSNVGSWNDNNRHRASVVLANNGGAVDITPNQLGVTNVSVILAPTGSITGGTLQINPGSVLTGTGTLHANLINSGVVTPGGTARGRQVVAGTYTQTSGGRLDMEIAGLVPDSEHDVLEVVGHSALDGTLNLTRPGGFLPLEMDQFKILEFASHTGDFSGVNGADLPSNLTLHRVYSPTDLTLNTLPWVTIDDVIVTEGDSGTSQAIFTVSMSAPAGFNVSVDYASIDGLATDGSDYEGVSGSQLFQPGETQKQVFVDIKGDPGRERNETFFIDLSNISNAQLRDSSGIGIITNDDPLPSISMNHVAHLEGDSGQTIIELTATLSSPAVAPLTVGFETVDGTAEAGTDYSATSGTLEYKPAPSAGLVSNGSHGAFNPTGNVTLNIPEDGIFHFTSINIPNNVTVRFNRNADNTPVIMLATEDVSIAGAVIVSSSGQIGGPGGGNGGAAGHGTSGGGDGLGLSPGEGGADVPPQTLGNAGGGGGFATEGTDAVRYRGGSPGDGGAVVGLPLDIYSRGGSGGGGGSGWVLHGVPLSGGHGGGAGGGIIIVTQEHMTVSGTIQANGANGGFAFANAFGHGGPGAGGSGGIIDLEAQTVTLTSTARLQANGGVGGGISTFANSTSGANGGLGYARVTAFEITNEATIDAIAHFEDFDLVKTIQVEVNGDTIPELDETFLVDLVNPLNAVLIPESQGQGTILNDDGPINEIPVAHAGGPYVVGEGGVLQLDGSGSSDADQPTNSLTFEWDFSFDGLTFDVDATGELPIFSAANLDGPLTQTIALRVTDSEGAADLATAEITIENVSPTAHAGGPYTVLQGNSILVDASQSTDPGNDISLYEWDLNNDGQFDEATGPMVSYTAVNDGLFTISVRVTDSSGVFDTAQATVQVDPASLPPSPPDLVAGSDTGSSATDDLTSDNTPTFSGTARHGETIKLFSSVNGLVGTTTAASSGEWIVTASTLEDGEHEVFATATTAAGLESDPGEVLIVTVDTNAPAPPSAPDLISQSDSGASDFDNVTKDNTPTFDGSVHGAAPSGFVEYFRYDGSSGFTVERPADMAFGVGGDFGNDLYIVDPSLNNRGRVFRVADLNNDGDGQDSGEGGVFVAFPQAGSFRPQNLVFGSGVGNFDNDLFLSDDGPNRIFRVSDNSGSFVVSSFAGPSPFFTPSPMDFSPSGQHILIGDAQRFTSQGAGSDGRVYKVTDTGAATLFADGRNTPNGLWDVNANTARTTSDGWFTMANGGIPGVGTELLQFRDNNNDGDANDAGEARVVIPGGVPNTRYVITMGPDDAVYISGSNARSVYKHQDLNNDGDFYDVVAGAFDPGERTLVVDGLPATIYSMAVNSDNQLFVGMRITSPAREGIIARILPLRIPATPGDQVELYSDTAGLVGTGVVDDDLNWAITSTTLSDGVHSVRARVIDQAGNISEFSESLSVTIDTVAPDAPVIQSPADGSTTDDTTPTVRGFTEPNSNVELFQDGGSLGVILTGATGQWSLTTAHLEDGDYQFTATATDLAGNISDPSTTSTLTVQTNQPPVAHAGGPYTVDEGDVITLNGMLSSDPDQSADSLIYEWDFDYDGANFTLDATGSTPTFSAVTLDGPQTLTIALRVTDNEGVSDLDSTTVQVVNVAPTASVGGPYSMNEGGSITLDASGSSDPAHDIVSYEWDLDNDGQYDDATGPTASFSAQDDGIFDVSVRVTDSNGDADVESTTVTVHNVRPLITSLGISSPDGENPVAQLSGTFSDAGPLDTVSATINWGDTFIESGAVTQNSGAGSFSASHTYTADGLYTVSVEVCDDDGGCTTGTLDVSVDTTSPSTTAHISGTQGNNGWWVSDVTVTLTATDNLSGVASMLYRVGGGSFLLYSGPFEISGDALHELEFYSIDHSGNIESTQAETVMVDTTAPVVVESINDPDALTGWYNIGTGTAVVTYACDDNLSGVVGCPTLFSFGEGENQSLAGVSVMDAAGNTSAVTTGFGGINVDLTGPGISIVNPIDEAEFLLNQPVSADFTCNDSTSGVVSCSAPEENGAAIPTHTAGAHEFRVEAMDGAGNISTLTSTYYVGFDLGDGFLPPMRQHDRFATKRTIPAKFQLFDYLGQPISDLSAIVSIQYDPINPDGPPEDAISTGGAGLSYSGNHFHFNWDTRGLDEGEYQFTVTLSSGQSITKQLELVAVKGKKKLLDNSHADEIDEEGELLAGDLYLYAEPSISTAQFMRLESAVTAISPVIEEFGARVFIVPNENQNWASLNLRMDSSSPCGDMLDGVLGCTVDADEIVMISGWNWFLGSEPALIDLSQYDYQSVITHELAHALGVGHSDDPTSVMSGLIPAGAVRRSLDVEDLIHEEDESHDPSAAHGTIDSIVGDENANPQERIPSASWAALGAEFHRDQRSLQRIGSRADHSRTPASQIVNHRSPSRRQSDSVMLETRPKAILDEQREELSLKDKFFTDLGESGIDERATGYAELLLGEVNKGDILLYR